MSAIALQELLQGIREVAFIKDIVQIEMTTLSRSTYYRTLSDQPLCNATWHYLLGAAEMVTY
jgi:hypothetical protein